MPIFRASMVVLLISLFTLAHSLSCHEGFNVSFSEIPFYYWAEHQCARDSECFVQEITSSTPNTKLKGNVLRFGGCVSMSLASHITCEQLYEENSTLTIKNVFDILRGLDDKVDKLVEDMLFDGDTHLGRFFSRGKGSEEFIAGVLEFLEAVGYDKSKIEAPLNNLARAVVDDDTASMMNAGVELLTSAQVNNQATKMLSRALLHFVSQVVDGHTPLVVLGCAVYGPGLLYPILGLNIAPDELDNGYIAVAKGFINLDIEQPQAAVAENYQAAFFNAVVLVQSLISGASPESRDKAYQTTKKVIQVYKEANLDSSLPEQILMVADLLDKYVKKLTSLPSCGATDFDCSVKNMLTKVSLQYEISEQIREISGRSKWISKETDPEEEPESLMEPLTDLIDSIQKWNSESLLELFDLLQPKVENLADKLGHKKIEFRKSLSPDTCSHLRCTESLCNSHEAFSSQKNSDKSSILKKEL